jgi:hypothetical protein
MERMVLFEFINFDVITIKTNGVFEAFFSFSVSQALRYAHQKNSLPCTDCGDLSELSLKRNFTQIGK